MVTLESAENALKTVYLGVVSNQLNVNSNPLLSKIAQTTSDVWGNEIRKLAPYGLNGGVGAGTESGDLPTAFQNKYVKFVSDFVEEKKEKLLRVDPFDRKTIRRKNNMCGIVGFVGKEQAAPILLDGLRRLEYRGYDSAGIAVCGEDGLRGFVFLQQIGIGLVFGQGEATPQVLVEGDDGEYGGEGELKTYIEQNEGIVQQKEKGGDGEGTVGLDVVAGEKLGKLHEGEHPCGSLEGYGGTGQIDEEPKGKDE